MTDSGKHFELVFEGPADDSAETSRRLRTTLLADLGMSVVEAMDVLQNSPRTLKTAETEEDLKPIYTALKKAGGKVLIVKPTVSKNDDAYFLDMESSGGITDDLIASLESTPASEPDEDTNEKHYALDVTPESPLESTAPIIPEQVRPSAESVTDLLLTLEKEAATETAAEQPETESPAAAVVADDKPLFEFSAPEATPPPPPTPVATAPEPTFDLSIELEDSPQEQKASAASSSNSKSAPSEDPFSSQALSLSLSSSEPEPPKSAKHSSKPEKPAPAAPSLSMALEAEAAPPAAQVTPKPTAIGAPVPSTPPKPAASAAVPSSAESTPVGVTVISGTPKKSKGSGSQLPLDILVPIVVGALILGVANWMYFQNKTSKLAEIDEKLLNAESSDSQVSTAVKRERPAPVAEPHVRGKEQTSDYSFAWSMPLDKDMPRWFSFELTTPQPSPLTPEEIVRKAPARPWLQKVEADHVLLEAEADGVFRAQAQARVFVEQGSRKRRVPASMSLRVEREPSSGTWTAHIRVWRGYNELEDLPTFNFELMSNDDVRLAIRGDFSGMREER
ncbi:MAG: hypothetical protein K1X79_04400 [Oligoflexia bacterium]|nr:hypothetical protein [Oligoflexia bacterium]